MSKKNICPVCGFDELKEPPYSKEKEPSYEICPCCGFEFGFDDDYSDRILSLFRQKWIEAGAKWFIAHKKPQDWDLNKQLQNLDNI